MTTTPRFIAFCSPAMGSGKTTAARHLVDAHGFVRIAFAAALKNMAIALLQSAGMDDDEITARIYGMLKEAPIPVLDGMTSRRLQQLIGTEFGRGMIHEDVWVNITMGSVRSHLAAGRSVVIDDMRFPNEYQAVIDAGGDCYRIVRPDVEVTAAHASEGQLDLTVMPEVWNIGTEADLRQVIDALLVAN